MDPETRYTATGRKVCQFTLSVTRLPPSLRFPQTPESRGPGTGGGDLRRPAGDESDEAEAADRFSVEAWGRLGEVCQQYLAKGRLIYLEGRLQTERREGDDESRYLAKVVASSMQMLDRKPEEMEVIADS
jgi:single-strand DNA-binding protein